jgi:hypothetical protein
MSQKGRVELQRKTIKIQTKNPFDEILSLSFDLGPLKVNSNTSNRSQFCKGLSKGLI